MEKKETWKHPDCNPYSNRYTGIGSRGVKYYIHAEYFFGQWTGRCDCR